DASPAQADATPVSPHRTMAVAVTTETLVSVVVLSMAGLQDALWCPSDAPRAPRLTTPSVRWTTVADGRYRDPMVNMPGLAMTDHTFTVPLDHSDPGGATIGVFAREVVAPDAGGDRPWLLFLQGGPGGSSPRPVGP